MHRDISPQNVMITPEGEAKVTDFGVSRDLTQQTMTATSMLMGKPLYIAPEVATGASKADIRSDIYALGVVLFQMLTGQVPFNADTPLAVMQMHVVEPVPSLSRLRPDVPAWLEQVVEVCLEKRPIDRFQKPADLLDVLEADGEATFRLSIPSRPRGSDERTVLNKTPTSGVNPERQDPLRESLAHGSPQARRNGWMLLSGLLASVTLAVGIAFLVFATSQENSSQARPAPEMGAPIPTVGLYTRRHLARSSCTATNSDTYGSTPTATSSTHPT